MVQEFITWCGIDINVKQKFLLLITKPRLGHTPSLPGITKPRLEAHRVSANHHTQCHKQAEVTPNSRRVHSTERQGRINQPPQIGRSSTLPNYYDFDCVGYTSLYYSRLAIFRLWTVGRSSHNCRTRTPRSVDMTTWSMLDMTSRVTCDTRYRQRSEAKGMHDSTRSEDKWQTSQNTIHQTLHINYASRCWYPVTWA